MNIPFIIFSPPYDSSNGGAMVLHKLAHLLNIIGEDAYIFPYFPGLPIDKNNSENNIVNYNLTKKNLELYNCNHEFTVKCLNKEGMDTVTSGRLDFYAIYPEITSGNPLNSKYVVRWLLHHPGFHSKNVNFSSNELYIKHGPAIKDINVWGSKTSNNYLNIIHYLEEFYFHEDNKNREGTCYSIRKGLNKKIIHDTSNSILIDGLSHEEIAKIFKIKKTFISYDTASLYSQYAAICGCESIIIPDYGISMEQWQPDISNTYGLSYGFENIDYAKSTLYLLHEKISQSNNSQLKQTEVIANEIKKFFTSNF